MAFSPEPDNRLPARMPILLRILALLHLIGGGAAVVLIVANFSSRPDLSQTAEMIGASPLMIYAGILFLVVLGLATGIGMFSRQPWGWWVASFYYVYAILRSGNALLFVIAGWEELATDIAREPQYYLLKYAGRILVHFLVLLYLCRPAVLEYFGLEHFSPWKALFKLFGAGIVYFAVSTMSNAFS